MKKENIISINYTQDGIHFTWAVKRQLPDFKEAKKAITGIYFPWNQIFGNEENITEISQERI